MLLQGTIFDPSAAGSADGTTQSVNMGRANDLIVSELHGKYFQQCYRGNVFYVSTTAAGVVLPIYTTLTPTFTIWNPAGSGKLMVPLVTLIGWTSTTPSAQGELVYMATTAAGSSISATAPFVAIGTGSAVNANMGSGKVSQMKIGSGGTTTIVAAATFFRSTGMTILATTAANAGGAGWVWRDDWDGSAVIPPGNAIHLMGTTATLMTVTVTLAYAEIPL